MKCPECQTEMEWTEEPSSNLVKCPKCGYNFRMIDILDRLRNLGWRAFEVKTPTNRERSCWVSSEGNWYNVTFAHHQIFATYVAKEVYSNEVLSHYDDKAGDVLKKHGWILIHHDWTSGTIVHNFQSMTEKQYRVMLDFFGEEKLFRGWTVRAMWLAKEDMKEAAK